MLYPDVPTASINAFNGAVTRLDPYQVQPSDGLLSLNCAYNRGEVSKRYGHSTTYAQTGSGFQGASLSLDNWTFSIDGTQVSALVYYVASHGLLLLNQIGPAFLNLVATTGAAGVSCAFDGERLYVAFYDSTGRLGTTGGNVYGWNVGADPLFASPITNTPSISNTGSGTITGGVHNFAYLITTRNGFTTMLCPSAGGIFGSASGFAPVAFSAAGSQSIEMQISIPTLPSYLQGGSIQVVMTTVANLNQYFAVPGATTIAVSGTNTIIFTMDDATLAATGTDVTGYLNLLVSGGSTPPFYPSAVFTYSGRMGYIAIDGSGFPVVYFSDPSNY